MNYPKFVASRFTGARWLLCSWLLLAFLTLVARAVPPDTTIYNLAVQPRPSSAIITWSNATPAVYEVDYGLTTNYEVGSLFSDNDATNQAALLTGLVSNQTYYIQVTSYFDDANFDVTTNSSFSTDLTIVLQSQQASYSGVWINDTSAEDRYSPIYKYASIAPPAPTAQATFRPAILTPAQYDVYLWYSEGGNRSAVAPVLASYQGGAVSTTVNETAHGGSWQLIASNQTFAAGNTAFVRLGNNTGEYNKIVIADAVEWTYTPGQDLPVNGQVPAWWANYYFGTNTIDSSQPGANGCSLLNDYILGIAADDPYTTLSLSLYPVTGGFQVLFYPWEGGRIYQLQSATNLANPVWQTLTNLPVTTDGFGDGLITSTNIPKVATFYRLSVQLSP